MGGFIRAGEMAHKRFDHQPVEQAGCSLLRGKAQPVHPGVDHHVAGAAARLLPPHDLCGGVEDRPRQPRSEEHTSELQSLMRISYAVFCLTKKKYNKKIQ